MKKNSGITHHDYTTGNTVSLNYPLLKSLDIRVINPSEIVICGINDNNQLSASYFDGINWNATSFPVTAGNCSLSMKSSTSSEFRSRLYLGNNNVWLYAE